MILPPGPPTGKTTLDSYCFLDLKPKLKTNKQGIGMEGWGESCVHVVMGTNFPGPI